MQNLEVSKVRGQAQRAMIIEAAKAARDYEFTLEPTGTPESIRVILVETLGWMTEEEYQAALYAAETELLPLLDELEQEQLEYEYQQQYNI